MSERLLLLDYEINATCRSNGHSTQICQFKPNTNVILVNLLIFNPPLICVVLPVVIINTDHYYYAHLFVTDMVIGGSKKCFGLLKTKQTDGSS